ncbi:MAG: hypothetical protein V1736_04085 [Pseudomonadota bacterium]
MATAEKPQKAKAQQTKSKAEVAKETATPKAAEVSRTAKATATRKVKTLALNKAKALNISAENLAMADLIRTVQRAEGYFACFGTATAGCEQEACCWRAICVTL